MPMGKLFRDPVADAQQAAQQEAGPPRLRRIEAALAQPPALPRIALIIVAAGLTLIVVLAIVATERPVAHHAAARRKDVRADRRRGSSRFRN